MEDRAFDVCIIEGDNMKKVLTPRTVWREHEKNRKEGHETDKTKPLRSHSFGGNLRSVVAKVLYELLQSEAGERASQVDQQGMTYLFHLDVPSLDRVWPT